ncbi:hypothetical protein [uncultured Microscilla sp.]|uniref:hypothetical protein n=1 Tax=uncultured Microscilla sp. TaxID=432653 RepID=UPI002630C9B7|nr:hypothetical protein [uncultured Microscilla sp.]
MKHQQIINYFVFTIIFTASTLQASAQNIVGTYRSNFPLGGFFMTTVKLHANGSFDHHVAGDMQHQHLQGTYVQKDGKVYLKVEPKKDAPVDLSTSRVHNYTLKQISGVSYHLLYHVGRKRLYAHHEKSGKRIIRKKNYAKNRRQKYYLHKLK